MIYRQTSMEKIARLFDFEGSEYAEMVKNWPYGDKLAPMITDLMFAYACNTGKLKCGHVPLNHESNDYTSTIG